MATPLVAGMDLLRSLARTCSTTDSGTSRPGTAPSNTSTGANSYLWDFGDGESSTEKAPSHVYQRAGAFDVIVRPIEPMIRFGVYAYTRGPRPPDGRMLEFLECLRTTCLDNRIADDRLAARRPTR